jgi:cyclic-di-GMP-binding biofilm dispersal mediator protein
VAEVIKQQEPLDILVINAGVAIFGNPPEVEPSAIDRLIDINVRGPYHAAVEAGQRMNDNGRIIVIGSVNGDRMPFAGGAAYALSKSAVQGLVRGLARDLGDRGITVNNVQPGPVDTDMNPADGPMKDLMHAGMAIKRHGSPEEIAGMVAYLAGPEAAFVTGAQHTIDGGFGA